MGISSSPSKALKKNGKLQLTTEKLGRFSKILPHCNPSFLGTEGKKWNEVIPVRQRIPPLPPSIQGDFSDSRFKVETTWSYLRVSVYCPTLHLLSIFLLVGDSDAPLHAGIILLSF